MWYRAGWNILLLLLESSESGESGESYESCYAALQGGRRAAYNTGRAAGSVQRGTCSLHRMFF